MTPLSTRLHRLAEFDEDKYARHIQTECERWADWKRMSEMEQDETYDGYLAFARMENARLQPLIEALIRVAEAGERVHSVSGYVDTHNAHAELGDALAALREVK